MHTAAYAAHVVSLQPVKQALIYNPILLKMLNANFLNLLLLILIVHTLVVSASWHGTMIHGATELIYKLNVRIATCKTLHAKC